MEITMTLFTHCGACFTKAAGHTLFSLWLVPNGISILMLKTIAFILIRLNQLITQTSIFLKRIYFQVDVVK